MKANVAIDVVISVLTLVYELLKSLVLFFVPKKEKNVSRDIVLITGGGSGLGRLVAVRFAELGSIVVLWDVNEKGNLETDKIIKDLGGKSFTYTCDLSNRNDVYETAAKVKREVGKVTILINNAGIVSGKKLLETPDVMIEKTFEVNIMAHFWTVKSFLPDMIQMQQGHIVTIASTAGFIGISQLTDYTASKYAAVGFNEALTAELHADGFHKKIRTTVICPYFVNTGMFDGIDSRLFPILTPEKVSATIVKSVLTNSEMVIIPKYMSVVVFFKSMLPISVFNLVSSKFVDLTKATFPRKTTEYHNNKSIN